MEGGKWKWNRQGGEESIALSVIITDPWGCWVQSELWDSKDPGRIVVCYHEDKFVHEN